MPQISGGPPPTIPFAPSMPLDRSAMCIEPPLPRHDPVRLPKISAIIGLMSTPLAMQWPCPRCVDAMVSRSGSRCAHTPVADASSPAYKCTKPGMSPVANSSCTRSSKARMDRMVRYTSSNWVSLRPDASGASAPSEDSVWVIGSPLRLNSSIRLSSKNIRWRAPREHRSRGDRRRPA